MLIRFLYLPQGGNTPVQVQIEPDRKGWAQLVDMYHKYDEDRIRDAKEDIDTLLVFVSTSIYSFLITNLH